jgi:hypothetical protein
MRQISLGGAGRRYARRRRRRSRRRSRQPLLPPPLPPPPPPPPSFLPQPPPQLIPSQPQPSPPPQPQPNPPHSPPAPESVPQGNVQTTEQELTYLNCHELQLRVTVVNTVVPHTDELKAARAA